MKIPRLTRARRVASESDRLKALAVMRATYEREKAWVRDVESMFPKEDLVRSNVSWFLATRRNEPMGVLRVLYDPPIDQYQKYGLTPIDGDLTVYEFIKSQRIAEVGRFAVIPERRKGVGVVLSLMRAATREIVFRGYTQLVTDVFENDPHSPFRFHTRIVGFRPVATHEVGELSFKGRRITLLLDIKIAYQTLKSRGSWFFRAMTKDWTDVMHKRLA
ncbi:MAG TPA: hypothetical protein VKC66_09630 [Xanthobacteraceae bacterium]|nr:hypothetical protein [Xanthobacteraceae bacterium]